MSFLKSCQTVNLLYFQRVSHVIKPLARASQRRDVEPNPVDSLTDRDEEALEELEPRDPEPQFEP